MTVTFCGHGERQYSDKEKEQLYNIIENQIKFGADKFLLGGYGRFDIMAAHTVKQLKEKYPHIESTLVIPYINSDYNKNLYDNSLYPPIETTPKRFAIIKRNEWMVSVSDVLVCFVEYDWGGAYKTWLYAKRKHKKIINISPDCPLW